LQPCDLFVYCTAIMRGGRGGGYGPHHQTGGGVPAHGHRSPRQITKHLEIPNELIGTIIGRHGMKISEIRYYHYAVFRKKTPTHVFCYISVKNV